MKKRITVIALLIILTLTLCACSNEESQEASESSLYDNAVIDAMVAEDDEVLPLVTLSEDDDMTTWNEDGKVLLLSWHSYPESYIEGESTVLEFGDVWTFTDKEIIDWFSENGEDVSDWELRFEQLIGLPESDEKTHFTAFWVDVNDVVRPAYEPDPMVDSMVNTYTEDMDEEYKNWFDDNIISSYFESEEMYPWTRLGYTYDWADNGTDYGLTEFLVKQNATVDVEFTKSTDEFLEYLEENS